jgi:hypothetical protein
MARRGRGKTVGRDWDRRVENAAEAGNGRWIPDVSGSEIDEIWAGLMDPPTIKGWGTTT